MIRIFLILIFGLITINGVYAKIINGYYITKSNDTITVLFKIPTDLFGISPDYEKIQRKVKFFDSANKKHTLLPDSIKEYSFVFKGERSRMVSKNMVSLTEENEYLFLRQIIEGRMKLYAKYYSMYSGATPNGLGGWNGGGVRHKSKYYIMQKGTGILFTASWFSFKDDMLFYVTDCPGLSKKIETRTYLYGDIIDIVNDYNLNCK